MFPASLAVTKLLAFFLAALSCRGGGGEGLSRDINSCSLFPDTSSTSPTIKTRPKRLQRSPIFTAPGSHIAAIFPVLDLRRANERKRARSRARRGFSAARTASFSCCRGLQSCQTIRRQTDDLWNFPRTDYRVMVTPGRRVWSTPDWESSRLPRQCDNSPPTSLTAAGSSLPLSCRHLSI